MSKELIALRFGRARSALEPRLHLALRRPGYQTHQPRCRSIRASRRAVVGRREKQRWISLPEGEVIDNSDPNEWIFPIGTKVWKGSNARGDARNAHVAKDR